MHYWWFELHKSISQNLAIKMEIVNLNLVSGIDVDAYQFLKKEQFQIISELFKEYISVAEITE